MSAEQERALSLEELKTRCEKLTRQRALSPRQFIEFVEYFCLLTGKKPEVENQWSIMMKHQLDMGSWEVELEWRRDHSRRHYQGVGNTEALVTFINRQPETRLKKESFRADNFQIYHSVEFISATGDNNTILTVRLVSGAKRLSPEAANTCRAVLEIYNSSKS